MTHTSSANLTRLREERSGINHQLWRKYLGFGLAIVLFLISRVASPADSLLTELPVGEGADLIAPYELWVATFAPDEGSYGSGPRILIITNDRKTAVAYVRGKRVELQHVGELVWRCEVGGSMKESYRAGTVTVTTDLTTSPGEESCWVEGAISVSLEHKTQTFRVKVVHRRLSAATLRDETALEWSGAAPASRSLVQWRA